MNTTSPKDIFQNNSRTRYLEYAEKYLLMMSGSGGAIYCHSSTLNINNEYSVFANNFAQRSGGAIYIEDGNITINGSVKFLDNVAREYEGGAMFLGSVTLIVSGGISFINNKAFFGGALSIFQAKLLIIVGEEIIANEKSILNDTMRFCRNVAMNEEMASIEAEAEYVSGLTITAILMSQARGWLCLVEILLF